MKKTPINISFAAIVIAYTVVNGKQYPDDLSFAAAGQTLYAAGHRVLLKACDDAAVVAAYQYRDCAESIAVLRDKFPLLMQGY